MGFYKITSAVTSAYSISTGAYLPTEISHGTNVKMTLTANQNIGNTWYIPSIGDNVQVVNIANMRFRLAADSSSWNCDVRIRDYAAKVNFKAVSGESNTYRIQLANNPNMYLTMEKSEINANVKWATLDATNNAQKWQLKTIDCIYVYANNWLRMRTTPSAAQFRNVSIPTVPDDPAEDGITYKFTDKSYWATGEGLLGDTYKINEDAYNIIKNKTGKAPTINVGEVAGCTDENGRYWVAVGPRVVYPAQSAYEEILSANMYAKGYLDFVIKDDYGTSFYIPCVVGDTKLHTWSNGIIQTWRSYPVPRLGVKAGDLTSVKTVGDNSFNGQVCAEFINADYSTTSTLKIFSIDYIRFYTS